jgi:predicted nucleic acid-binding protein
MTDNITGNGIEDAGAELDKAMDKEIGFTVEQVEKLKQAEEEETKEFMNLTMEEILRAIRIVNFYVQSREKADKAMGKLAKGGSSGGMNDLIGKMMGGMVKGR